MKRQTSFVVTGVIMLAVAVPGKVFAEEQILRPSKTLITGAVDGEEVEKLAPPHGFLAKKEDFAPLWKAWLLEDTVPEVDFTKNLVVVATSREGPISKAVLVDEKKTGHMTIRIELEGKSEGGGLHCWIGVFPRAGVRTIQGKALGDR